MSPFLKEIGIAALAGFCLGIAPVAIEYALTGAIAPAALVASPAQAAASSFIRVRTIRF